MSVLQFKIVPEHGGAARQIERQLRASIVSMQLRPGERLSEVDIAARFGVSRQPVREALIALAKAELVDVMPQRGTVVVKISLDKVMQARLIREQIEVGVARQACESRLGPAVIGDIQTYIDKQAAALEADDIAGFKSADEDFHEALAKAAGLPLAWRTIADLKSHLARACNLTLETCAHARPLLGHHQAILDAIAACDADAAEKAMRFHLTEILRAIKPLMTTHADLFE